MRIMINTGRVYLAALALSLVVFSSSCGNSGGGGKSMFEIGYEEGYKRGARDMARRIRKKAHSIRGNLKHSSARIMLWGSISILLLTLFGARIAEFFRMKISERFKLPLDTQILVAEILYFIVVGTPIAWGLYHYTLLMNLPIFILLSGTIHPFWNGLIPAMSKMDKMSFRLNLGKVKTLVMVSFVLIATYYILDKGIEGVI